MNTVYANIDGAAPLSRSPRYWNRAGAASMAVGSLQYLNFVKSEDLTIGEMIYLVVVLTRIRHKISVSPPKVR